jgi:hypothetical protein
VSLKGVGSKRPKTEYRSKPGSNREVSKEAKVSNRVSEERQSRIGQITEHRASSGSASKGVKGSSRTGQRGTKWVSVWLIDLAGQVEGGGHKQATDNKQGRTNRRSFTQAWLAEEQAGRQAEPSGSAFGRFARATADLLGWLAGEQAGRQAEPSGSAFG